MKTIEQLQEEDAALLATAGVLREALQAVMESIGGGKKFCGHEFDCVCAGDKARAALAATPQHHLREVRAEAGRAGFVQGYIDGYEQCGRDIENGDWTDDSEGILRPANDGAHQYAEQIRRGEVG